MPHAMPPADLVEKAIRATSLSQGFNQWLGTELVSIGDGKADIRVHLRPELMQHHGTAHGGIVATIADTVSAWAAASAVGDVVTSGLSNQYLAPVRQPTLRAQGTVLKAGRRTVSVETKVFGEAEDGTLTLVAAVIGSIVPVSKQPVTQNNDQN